MVKEIGALLIYLCVRCISLVPSNDVQRGRSMNLLTDCAFVRVIWMVPRVDVESVSLVRDLALDVPLVDEVLPQLARAIAIGISISRTPEAYGYYP